MELLDLIHNIQYNLFRLVMVLIIARTLSTVSLALIRSKIEISNKK